MSNASLDAQLRPQLFLGAQFIPKYFLADSTGRRRPISRGFESECAAVVKDSLVAKRVQRDAICEH